jgi:hypothetical protein
MGSPPTANINHLFFANKNGIVNRFAFESFRESERYLPMEATILVNS